jgi:hypothetical protein
MNGSAGPLVCNYQLLEKNILIEPFQNYGKGNGGHVAGWAAFTALIKLSAHQSSIYLIDDLKINDYPVLSMISVHS